MGEKSEKQNKSKGSAKSGKSNSERKLNLTDKQKVFCEEFLVDLNATQAAIRAGYSEKTANRIGSENLSKLDIQEYIQELKNNRSERTEIDADRVLREWEKLGFINPKNFYNEKGELIPIHKLPDHYAAAIKEVKHKKFYKDGEVTSETFSYELHDKVKGLENIGKHIGFYREDNDQKKLFPEGFKINIKK